MLISMQPSTCCKHALLEFHDKKEKMSASSSSLRASIFIVKEIGKDKLYDVFEYFCVVEMKEVGYYSYFTSPLTTGVKRYFCEGDMTSHVKI